MSDDIHTMPLNDLIEHQFHDCICRPATQAIQRNDGSFGWQIIHHSFDGREFTEPDYNGQPMPTEDKT